MSPVKTKEVVEETKSLTKEIKSDAIETIDTVKGPKPKYIHWVQPQESLEMVAHYYLIEVAQIKKWNNLENEEIKAGDKLRIMESSRDINIVKDTTKIDKVDVSDELGKAVEEATESKATADAKVLLQDKNNDVIKAPSKFVNVLVEPGTTLYGLSKEYDVSVDDIKKYNHLKSNSLSAGDKLAIPVYEDESETPIQRLYVVQVGDTFYSISKKLGVSVETLKIKNNKTENALHVGEELKY